MKSYDGYALITGASSGIGLAFAKELASKGYDLVIISEDKEGLKQTESLLKRDYKVDVFAIFIDLSNLNAAKIVFNQLQQKNIHVGLLVNNAGFAKSGYFHEIDLKVHLALIKLMCLNLMEMTYRFLPPMLANKSGGIIIISSTAAFFPPALAGVYGAVKGFSFNFGNVLYADYASKGIDVLTVCPSFVETNIYTVAGQRPPPFTLYMTPEYVAQKSLAALGKKIVLTLTGKQWDVKALLLLRHILPYKTLDKIQRLYIKKFRNIDL